MYRKGPSVLNQGTPIGQVSKRAHETTGKTIEEGLELLSKVGLNDAFVFLRTYNQLSDGQKYRYQIAKMMESQAQFWIMDEFAATLDRDTAKIVAFNVQKSSSTTRQGGASSHNPHIPFRRPTSLSAHSQTVRQRDSSKLLPE